MTKSGVVSLSDYNIAVEHDVLTVAVAATFTAEPVESYINWWCRQFGVNTQIQFAPYNQVFQQLLDETSLISLNNGINILFVRFEDWLRLDRSGEEAQIEKLERNFNDLIEIIKTKKIEIPYFIGIFPVHDNLNFSNRVLNYIRGLYERWTSTLKKVENINIIDCRALDEMYNICEVFDNHMDSEAHMPFSYMYYGALGTAVARKIISWKRQHFKVIVLDCDNTLWRGICGEDGAYGVIVDEPFRIMQEFLLECYKNGIVLALCSKNNEADVWEVFDKNHGMVLKKEHFVNWKINWHPKSVNIKEMAEELNLGTDSFIFIDDSAVECTEVMMNLPEVLTLRLPVDPAQVPAFLYHTWAFDRFKVTKEDAMRTKMYMAEQKRKNILDGVQSLDGFIKGLGLKMSINLAENTQMTRAVQLINKTNQFNLSVIRRTEEELKCLIEKQGYMCHVIEVSDRFGDYGLVGVVITKLCGSNLYIDTFLLSCRVLGRKIEDAILVGLKKLSSQIGANMLEADFRPTEKNMPIRSFLERTGWRNVEENIEYVKFLLGIQDIPDRQDLIECCYNSRFESTETAVETEHTEYTFEGEKPYNKHFSGNTWDVLTVNQENLIHKSYLIPLENSEGKKLIKLPVNKNNREAPSLRKREKYAAPCNKVEKLLIEIWKVVLGIDEIGVNERFLDVGGDSIKAVYVSKECMKRGLRVSTTDIFTYRTVSKIAENIKPGNMENVRFDADDLDISTSNSTQAADETVKLTLKKLKINPQRKITTYLHRSLPLCAILAHEEYLPWFYQHYIQIFAVTYNNG
ncbi:MAG TPA: HAD-IIIC family phosphatase, partial [Clostridia bacterium]